MMQTGAIAWVDTAEDSKSRKVLAPPGLQVPGVRMFGYHSTAHAIAALERHYHEACFEFTFLIQGNVRFRVAEHVYRLSGGDLFFTLPDEVHDTASAPMSLHQMYWFQLDVSDPAQFLYMAPDAAGALIRQLLLEGRSVTDIAMELGFSSSNYFSSVFRRYTAMSPTQYLAANSKDGT